MTAKEAKQNVDLYNAAYKPPTAATILNDLYWLIKSRSENGCNFIMWAFSESKIPRPTIDAILKILRDNGYTVRDTCTGYEISWE